LDEFRRLRIEEAAVVWCLARFSNREEESQNGFSLTTCVALLRRRVARPVDLPYGRAKRSNTKTTTGGLRINNCKQAMQSITINDTRNILVWK